MSLLYRLIRACCRLLLRLNGAQLRGLENIPPDEPLLLIANHSSFADPVIIATLYPQQLAFIAKEEFSRQPLTRRLFAALGAQFLSAGESDFSALRAVIHQLKAGKSVLLFPEGTRRFDQRIIPFQPGAAYIAQKTQVRLLPFALVNSGDIGHPGKRNIIVQVGRPLDPPPAGKPEQALLDEHTALYQQEVERLFDAGRSSVLAAGRKMRHIPRSRRSEYDNAQ